MTSVIRLLCVFIGICILSNYCAAKKPVYSVVQTFHIASNGGWDYLAINPVNQQLYVSHGTQVNVLNKTSGDSTGVILHTDGVHGIAFAPEYKKGYVSNGRLNNVTVFDINTNEVLQQIATGENPDAIMYDAYSKRVYVCNGRSKDMSIIDPATNLVTATLPLGGKPEMAVSDGAGHIYINIEDKNELVMLNTATNTVVNRWSMGKGEGPTGLAIDITTKRLFAGCEEKLIVMNAENGNIVKELPIGKGCDGVAFDAVLHNIFTSNGDGTLSIIHEKSADSYEIMTPLTTKEGARTIAIDATTHKIYLPTADYVPATAGEVKKRKATVPGTFQVLVIAAK